MTRCHAPLAQTPGELPAADCRRPGPRRRHARRCRRRATGTSGRHPRVATAVRAPDDARIRPRERRHAPLRTARAGSRRTPAAVDSRRARHECHAARIVEEISGCRAVERHLSRGDVERVGIVASSVCDACADFIARIDEHDAEVSGGGGPLAQELNGHRDTGEARADDGNDSCGGVCLSLVRRSGYRFAHRSMASGLHERSIGSGRSQGRLPGGFKMVMQACTFRPSAGLIPRGPHLPAQMYLRSV